MNEWQPIETAPLNEEVVCLSPTYNGPVMLSFYRHNGLEAWRDWDQEIHHPTHWLPTPPPPPMTQDTKKSASD